MESAESRARPHPYVCTKFLYRNLFPTMRAAILPIWSMVSAGDVTFTDQLPERTDDGETSAPFLRVKVRVKEPEGPSLDTGREVRAPARPERS